MTPAQACRCPAHAQEAGSRHAVFPLNCRLSVLSWHVMYSMSDMHMPNRSCLPERCTLFVQSMSLQHSILASSQQILWAMQVVVPSKELAQKHYAEHDGKPFFPKLVDFLSSGAVVATVWEGKEVVKFGRTMIGATNPLASAPGTIRSAYTVLSTQLTCIRHIMVQHDYDKL